MPVAKMISILDQVGECLRSAAAHRRRTGRPFITLSYAQSLDGSIADRPGRPLAPTWGCTPPWSTRWPARGPDQAGTGTDFLGTS